MDDNQIKEVIANLHQLFQNENTDQYPVKIDESLYKKVQKIADELKYSKDINHVHARYYNNLLDIYEKLINIRIRKIIINVLNNKELFRDRLTEQEYQLYQDIKNTINEHKLRMLDLDLNIKIEIIEDVDQYVDLKGNSRGPFKKGQIIEIEREEGEWLINERKAKRVEKL